MVQWPRCFLLIGVAVATAFGPASAGAQTRVRACDEPVPPSAEIMFVIDGSAETPIGRSATIVFESRGSASTSGALRSASRAPVGAGVGAGIGAIVGASTK